MKYLVIMPYSWGVGNSIAEAEKIAREEGGHGRKKVKRICYRFDPVKTPECFLNNMGNLNWRGERPEKIDLEEKS